MNKKVLLLALLASFGLCHAESGHHKHGHKHEHEQKSQEDGIHPKRISKALSSQAYFTPPCRIDDDCI